MHVTVYDAKPGPGFSQWFLKTCWFLGCFWQKLIGRVDAYYGATSWDDALTWLDEQPKPLMSIQYWGHGSPGVVWLAGVPNHGDDFRRIQSHVISTSVLWFRTCSTFQGPQGHDFSSKVSTMLDCIVAGHTRIIGPFQGGLHTRKPNTVANWTIGEGEFPKSWWPPHMRWGNNTITCFGTRIPKGW